MRESGEQVNESVGLGDAGKNPRHEVRYDLVKGTCKGGSVTSLQWWKETSCSSSREIGSSSIPRNARSCASDKVVPVSCDPVHVPHARALTSWEAGNSDNYVKDCNMGTGSETLCPRNPIIGTSGSVDGDKGCHFSLEDSSPAVDDLGLLENGHKNGENDLMDYDWPDIGNFEDIDALFRNCDSTFGQGSTVTVDELSWFSSSSHAIYGSEDTFDSGLQSSCSELSVLNSTSGPYGANTNRLPEKDQTTAEYDKPSSFSCQSYADWLDIDAENNGVYANKGQADGEDENKPTALPQMSSGNKINGHDSLHVVNMHTKQLESQQSSLENWKDKSSQHKGNICFCRPGQIEQVADQKLPSSSVSALQVYSSQLFSTQNHVVESSSSSKMTTPSPLKKVGHGLLADQIAPTNGPWITKFENGTTPTSYHMSDHVKNHASQCMDGVSDHLFRPSTLKPVVTAEKLHLRHQVHARTFTESPSLEVVTSSASAGKRHHKFQHEVGRDNGKENHRVGCPAAKADSSAGRENSCMTSEYSDDISVEATSFRQLQDVMHQLDVKTKLRIRDSLYRLARSAEQRHSTANMNYSGASGDKRGVQGTEASKNSRQEFLDAETDTNPIDRSIARLLFHNPSENNKRLVDDTMSLESHIVQNGHIPVPNGDNSILQRALGGHSDKQL